MNRAMWTIGLAIASSIGYHLGQKSVPASASPLVVLALAYLTACVLCIGFLAVNGQSLSMTDIRASLGWPTWVIALSIVGIEVGFLLAYRSGWKIGIAFALSSTLTVVTLAILGALMFAEPLAPRRAAGLALAAVSVWLIMER